ncbi:IS3 family transposase [Luteococcus sp. OSA5]|uniref:IS3 family transposase n=1 Tax=Luteococcus sp. OSA5 TaxID=3401630 RepID=UPI003B42CE48
MPKVIDEKVRARAVRLVQEHRSEYPTESKVLEAVARQEGVGKESLRRWVNQAEVDSGARPGTTSAELEEIKKLTAENKRLREDVAILKAATKFLRGGTRPPQPMILGFIDMLRVESHAVEWICRVLREQGCQVAARTYRCWARGRVSARTVSDAQVADAVHQIVWRYEDLSGGGRRKVMNPEGLYGRRKMLVAVRNHLGVRVSPGSVDRVMRGFGLHGVRRDKGIRTTIPAKDGIRAGDLVNRDFTADAPNRCWVTDFTYCRTWAGWVYVAFIVDVFSQRIVAWHAQTIKHVDLVLTPLRMAVWQCERQGHPVEVGQLIHHSDAGSQYTSLTLTEHLALENIRPSIGTVGDAYDNALMETINGLYKAECVRTRIIHDGPYKSLADVEYATAGWVDWYNTRRLHSSIGNVPPAAYEAAHYEALTREPQPV